MDSDNRFHEGIRLHHTQFNLDRPQILQISQHDYIIFLKKLYRDQKASVLTDEESNMFEIKKGTKQGHPLSSLLFNTVLQKALEKTFFAGRRKRCMGTWFCRKRWKKTFLAGKRKRGMGLYLSDYDQDCLTNMRLADDVLLFASSKEQLQKKVL